MNQEKNPKEKNKISTRQLIIIGVTVAISCGIILLIGYFVNNPPAEFNNAEMAEITDEILRVRHFVSDWYAEISELSIGECKVHFNELRFEGSNYTVSTANRRLRAVYPRGERFFKFDYIDSVEFFKIDGKVRCRVYYGQTGEYTFACE